MTQMQHMTAGAGNVTGFLEGPAQLGCHGKTFWVDTNGDYSSSRPVYTNGVYFFLLNNGSWSVSYDNNNPGTTHDSETNSGTWLPGGGTASSYYVKITRDSAVGIIGPTYADASATTPVRNMGSNWSVTVFNNYYEGYYTQAQFTIRWYSDAAGTNEIGSSTTITLKASVT